MFGPAESPNQTKERLKRNWKKEGEGKRLLLDRAKYPALPETPDKGVSPDAPLCPKCRCYMVLCTSQYGQFWGCGQFPRCKGTRRV